MSGRLSRLLATGPDWAANEQVLLEDWCQQYPSHATGAIDFGADEKLYVSGGDGASFNNADWGQYGGTIQVQATPAPTSRPPIPAPIRPFRSARRRRSRRRKAARCAVRVRDAPPGNPGC